MTPVLEARGLTASYGATIVVRDLDLAVNAGEVVALLGPNGAGKTTTLLALSGALAPAAGDVLWEGQRITTPLHKRARLGLGIVSEQRAIFSKLTVRDNFKVSRCDEARATSLFPELEEHLGRPAGLLSGGQQQMVALARALTRGQPKLLLIDEISLGLAPQTTDRLLGAVREAATNGMGVLMVEQHIHKALAVADRACVMRRGQIVLSGSSSELGQNEARIQDAYLLDEPPSNEQAQHPQAQPDTDSRGDRDG